MTKRKKDQSEASVLELAAQWEQQFAECRKQSDISKSRKDIWLSGFWEGRAEVFRYCAIAMRQQLLGRAK